MPVCLRERAIDDGVNARRESIQVQRHVLWVAGIDNCATSDHLFALCVNHFGTAEGSFQWLTKPHFNCRRAVGDCRSGGWQRPCEQGMGSDTLWQQQEPRKCQECQQVVRPL